MDGGTPTRDVATAPWPSWHANTEEEWKIRTEPALREVYVSGVEDLVSLRREEFEWAFAEYCGVGHAVLDNNGTAAISAAIATVLK